MASDIPSEKKYDIKGTAALTYYWEHEVLHTLVILNEWPQA